jgi:TonB family protein
MATLKSDAIRCLDLHGVAKVTVLQSTGHKILDDAPIQALSRWRGRPSELMSRTDHVHVPVTFR